MRNLLIFLSLLFGLNAHSATITLGSLPLGSAASTGSTDSFPYTNVSGNETERLLLSDIINLPVFQNEVWPLANGGTAATTAVGALNNLLPSQSSHSGSCLVSNGSTASWVSCGTGTVTSVGLLDGSTTPIYSITNSPVSSTGTLTFTLGSQTKNTIFAGPTASSTAQPTFRQFGYSDLPSQTNNTVIGNVSGSTGTPSALSTTQLTALVNTFSSTLNGAVPASGGGTTNFLRADGTFANPVGITAPTEQKFLSGSGTYTRPSSPSPLYIRVRMAGGGGGGGGSNGGGSGGTGGTTTFGSSLLTANGGVGGTYSSAGTAGGAGGTATIGSGPIGFPVSGGYGAPATTNGISGNTMGSVGGVNTFAGGGAAGFPNNGAAIASAANTGAGGSSGGAESAASGSGGGAGGYIDAIITSPSSTYSYAVGAGGTAGSTGSGGTSTAGSAGIIIVDEYYQ